MSVFRFFICLICERRKMSLSNQIINGFIKKDQKCIEKVYLEYKNLMYFIIASYVDNQDDCDDVLSDAFLKAVEHADSVNDPSKLRSFICSIAKNEAINFKKKYSVMYSSDLIDEMYGEEDKTNTLLNTIEPLLTNKETIIVYLRIGFSYSWDEIVAETGIPESTGRRIYTKAMEKLRKELV